MISFNHSLILSSYNMLLLILTVVTTFHFSSAQPITDSLALKAPKGLLCDLLENTQLSYQDGYPTNISLQEAKAVRQALQQVTIQQQQPYFSWILDDPKPNSLQTAYRILVASDQAALARDQADVWDTGKISSDRSVAVRYEGTPLDTNMVYYWKVKVWNKQGEESPFSSTLSFKTGESFKEYATTRYPLQKTNEYPTAIKKVTEKTWFIDFGKDAFGQLTLNLFSDRENDTVAIHLGEALTADHRLDRSPGGTIRYQTYRLPLSPGRHTYALQFRPDERNTGSSAILMPDYIGEVMPFRYVEVEQYAYPLDEHDIVRQAVHYPFNPEASYFHSSDTVLNAVWDLCKYSIKATSFTGVYVDGDRERIPYEADALINQLCHYAVDREYSMARYSHEYLITHATWPTEWILQSVLMAWNDYLYTGHIASAAAYYEDLKAKTLMALAGENGLISTQNKPMTRELMDAIHFQGEAIRDIVDWPHSGILGLGKQEQGETDGFVFMPVNTVVNAYYYRALVIMGQLAAALDKPEDSAMFTQEAQRVKSNFNKALLDSKKKIYVDGIGTDHSSLHANMFSLAFGLVPEQNIPDVIAFIQSRGMACSVYGSQFLMEAIYEAEAADYGLSLLTSTQERGWYHMIQAGSTITMEAWDNKYKPNQDWNHAWGAAPANIIPRKLMGIEPVAPGFRKIRIKPQPGHLQQAAVVMPTIRGAVKVSFEKSDRTRTVWHIEIPANSTAEIHLPLPEGKANITQNQKKVRGKTQGKFFVMEVGSGQHTFHITPQ